MRSLLRQTSGSILIYCALAIAALCAFAVLSADLGRMLVTRTQLQNAADGGSLAGAHLFCKQGTPREEDIRAEVRRVGGANKAYGKDRAVFVPFPDSQVTIDFAEKSVRAIAQSEARQEFLGVLGSSLRSALVRAVACARCYSVCSVPCLKPWSIPDRWDDLTLMAGHPTWRGNGLWDREDYVDANQNRHYDLGESFTDSNGNGVYDQEYFDPIVTGYNADPTTPANILNGNLGDVGLVLVLKANKGSRPAPGQYFPIDFPPVNKGDPISGASQYRANIAGCNTVNGVGVDPGDELVLEPGNMIGPTNQGMRDLIALDPEAHWDPTTRSVVGSSFTISPRVVFLPVHDPRVPIVSGRRSVIVSKVVAFFIEEMVGNGEVRGRFLKTPGPGEPCEGTQYSAGFVTRLALIE